MIQSVKSYIDLINQQYEHIIYERKKLLISLADYILQKSQQNKTVNLLYICTHNSRRSQFAQVWSHVAADFFHVSRVNSYSGGTEVTAFHPNAIDALKRIGFLIEQYSDEVNPFYHVFFDERKKPVHCFSKLFSDSQHPQSEFAAIMTCGEAEQNCPFIPGAEFRIGLTYEDPKAFDKTPQQNVFYDTRCRQIALELFYIFSLVAAKQ